MQSQVWVNGLLISASMMGCSGRINLAALPDGGANADAQSGGRQDSSLGPDSEVGGDGGRDAGAAGHSDGASSDDSGNCTFGYAAPPAFVAGDGGGCFAAVGATANVGCDPSDEKACSNSSTCAIGPACNAGNSACEAFVKNTGTTDNFRIRLLEITAPPKLTESSFIQANVITRAVDLPDTPNSCGENGQGLLNWLISIDTATGIVTTGGAPQSADPFQLGYCFLNDTLGGIPIGPVTMQATVACSRFSTTPLAQTLQMPIFQSASTFSDAIVLPISGAFFKDVTVSNEGNCIGTVDNGALSPGDCTDSLPAGNDMLLPRPPVPWSP